MRSLSPASSIDFSPFYEHRPLRIGRDVWVPGGGVGWERKRGETTPYVRANTAPFRNPYNESFRAFVYADAHTGALRESERDVRAEQKYCVRGPAVSERRKTRPGKRRKTWRATDRLPRRLLHFSGRNCSLGRVSQFCFVSLCSRHRVPRFPSPGVGASTEEDGESPRRFVAFVEQRWTRIWIRCAFAPASSPRPTRTHVSICRMHVLHRCWWGVSNEARARNLCYSTIFRTFHHPERLRDRRDCMCLVHWPDSGTSPVEIFLEISFRFVSFRFVTTLISGIAVSCIVLLTLKGFPVIGSANELELIGNEFPDIFRNNWRVCRCFDRFALINTSLAVFYACISVDWI